MFVCVLQQLYNMHTNRSYHSVEVSMWFAHQGPEAQCCILYHIETDSEWYNRLVPCQQVYWYACLMCAFPWLPPYTVSSSNLAVIWDQSVDYVLPRLQPEVGTCLPARRKKCFVSYFFMDVIITCSHYNFFSWCSLKTPRNRYEINQRSAIQLRPFTQVWINLA